MGKLKDKWNKNNFSIYTSEEKTTLKLIENINNFVGDELVKEIEGKTDLTGNHLGSWQGLKKPTLSEEGMRATVEKLADNYSSLINYSAADFSSLNNMFGTIENGGKIYIPTGLYNENYIILNDLHNLTIEGNGYNTNVNFNDLISPLSDTSYYDDNQYVHIAINNCTNITFKNLRFKGVYNGNTLESFSHFCIIAGNSNNIKFENCIIENFNGEGILNNSTGDVKVSNCNMKMIRNSAIGTNSTGSFFCNDSVFDGVGIQPNNSAISMNSHFEIYNTTIRLYNVGVIIGHTGRKGKGIIKGNTFEYINPTLYNSGGAIIFTESDNVEIIENIFKGSFYDGINTSALTSNPVINIMNNKFESVRRNAISSFINKTRVTISNNIINNGENGIVLNGGNKGLIIENNKIYTSNYGIYLYGEDNNSNIISKNIINSSYGIYIAPKNVLNIISDDNIINATTKEIYTDISNTYYQMEGNKILYNYKTIPILDGVADGTIQSPSVNVGNTYITPTTTDTTKYVIFRFDNGYNGQIINIIASDNFTIFRPYSTNQTGSNIFLDGETDLQTIKNKVYSFKCVKVGDTLKWFLI